MAVRSWEDVQLSGALCDEELFFRSQERYRRNNQVA